MKKNVTLKLEEELLREARILAARKGTSVSRLLAGQLEVLLQQDQRYETARRRSLERLESGYDLQWSKPDSRGELHERKSLR